MSFDTYETFVFDDLPDPDSIPQVRIENFHWEKSGYARPETYVKFCAVKEKGFLALLRSREEPLLCRYTERDDPVYTDSCLEVFLQPVAGRKEYINFEINPNGAYLSQFGAVREGRTFIKELSSVCPEVSAKTADADGFWSAQIFIPQQLISELYGVDYSVSQGEICGNFYKCADDSPRIHYGALFPVGSEALGFHNPSAFGRIILKEGLY